MRYGYFDDQAREYVITRPDTPASWSNYLGSTEYGALITNNAGGYSFLKSGAKGRFLRLRFNSVPMDQPGRYFYIRDREDGDVWSASWQPVGKPLEEYVSVCRHGTAYSVITSKYRGIESESTYFVPLGQHFEYWRLKLTNHSDAPRNLSVFTYCEFTNQWDTFQDQVNLQYSLFIIKGELTADRLLRVVYHDNLSQSGKPADPNDQAGKVWMGLAGAELAGFDTSREAFLGTYGSYQSPRVPLAGQCGNSLAYGDNACGSLQADLTLAPGESRELLVLLGVGEAREEGARVWQEFGTLERAEAELKRLKDFWHTRLESLSVQTPDEAFNHTINVWGLYNALVTYAWSRSASLVYNGERDGLGFRDSVQDILGVVSAIPDEAGARLELMLTGQFANGGALPIVQPFDHHPGAEPPIAEEEFRSDDCLWFFNAVPAYVNETGNLAFYHKELPYADQGSASVFGHLKQALLFNLTRTGAHGLPCGLLADWNDCLRLGFHGESVFVAFQVRYALLVYAEIAKSLGELDEKRWAEEQIIALDERIQAHAWDADWFIWAITEDGIVYGTRDYPEGKLYFNTQVWAVISGAATPGQAEGCMQAVHDQLATPWGLMLCAPAFERTPVDVMRAVVFNPGIKENAGIFNHTQGWGVMAECLLGHGDRAFEYYSAAMPAAWNDRAEIRQCEPYVQGQTTYSRFSPRPGNTRTTWLTGAAAWSYFSATRYILGLRAELNGLRVDPCVPSGWDEFSVTRKFRGKTYRIHVQNPEHVCRGVSRMVVDGQEMEGSLVPAGLEGDDHQVEVWLGNPAAGQGAFLLG